MALFDTEPTAGLLERIGRLVSTEGHAHGLKPVQWEAMRYLARANRFSNTASALVAYLGLTKGTVSQTLKALEAKGLIRRQTDAADRRSARLSLTGKGRRLIARDPLDATRSALDSLPVTTRSQLTAGLEALLMQRLAAQGRQPFGQCRDCRYFERDHPQGGPNRCGLLGEKLNATDADAICVEQLPA